MLPTKELERLAKEAGISKASLRRASEQLRLGKDQVFDETGQHWVRYLLPPDTAPSAHEPAGESGPTAEAIDTPPAQLSFPIDDQVIDEAGHAPL